LKLKCDEALSNFAFNFKVRRYTQVSGEGLANMSVLGVSDPYVTLKTTNSNRPEQKSSVAGPPRPLLAGLGFRV
jgi:hypothetical protein